MPCLRSGCRAAVLYLCPPPRLPQSRLTCSFHRKTYAKREGYSSTICFSPDRRRPGWFTDEDAIPEISATPAAQPGDFWILGNHRLIWGDCTQADAIDRLLGGAKPLLVVTNPPYGIQLAPNGATAPGGIAAAAAAPVSAQT
jgi:hypothetical protein